MREIKFRVWDKEVPKNLEEAEKRNPTGQMINWNYVKVSSYFQQGLDGKVPLMQYTGLKDKNGKEIYEGDIVLNQFNTKGVVTWEKEYCWFYITYFDGIWSMLNVPFEVIGNIYDNPELLEGEK